MFENDLAYFNREFGKAYEIQEVYPGMNILVDRGRVLATIRPYGPNWVMDTWRDYDGMDWWNRVVC